MKKKIVKFGILSLFLIVFCTACNGNVTRDIRHAGFTVGNNFICNNFYPSDKEDTSYDRIRYFTGTHLIDTNGKIYELSLGQTFANNQNCKAAETDIKVKGIMDNKIVKAEDGKLYYLVAQNNVASYSVIPETDNSYEVYSLLFKDEDVIKIITADSSKGLYYILKSDGNVYGNVISRPDRNSAAVVTSTQVIYNRNDYGANIIDFNYAGENLSTFVKTEDKTFRMRITNSEQCSKYADIPCEFSMQEDPMFEEYKDKIIMFNGSTLITDYQLMFTVSN